MKKWLMIAVALVAAVGAGLWLRGGGNEQALGAVDALIQLIGVRGLPVSVFRAANKTP